ncbi:hypothetical protein A5719_21605 [Mycolicibacterium peregrinum]|nr:hypothetical protein A5719_21605 [Mycolicibacterium peregrinum]
MEAVIDIAGHEGERTVTLSSVASRLGVTHGLVRHYFGTCEALLGEAFQLAAGQDMSDSNIAADTVDDFARGLVDMLETDTARQLMQFDLVLSAIRDPRSADTAKCLYARFYARTASTLAHAGIDDPDGDWSALLFAMVDGISLQHFLFKDDRRTEAMLSRVRTVLALLAGDDGEEGPPP